MLHVGYRRAGVGVCVWRGGKEFLTLGFEASTLDFAECLEVSYPGLLRAVVS